ADLLRPKNYLRILLRLKDLPVHFVVAARVAGIGGGGVDDQHALRVARCPVKPYRPLLEGKLTVHRVEGSAQGKLHLAAPRIQFENDFLGSRNPRRTQKNNNCTHRTLNALGHQIPTSKSRANQMSMRLESSLHAA